MKLKHLKYWLFLFAVPMGLIGCKETNGPGLSSQLRSDSLSYKLEPVAIENVQLTDSFWQPILKRVRDKTIGYALQKIEEKGRLDNFLIAGGKMEGEVKGAMPFDDSDVYKIIEGASYSLINSPNDSLSRIIDSLIRIIKIGQEPDGYLTTWRTIDPDNPPAPWVEVIEGKRWESLYMSHELYNAGHLYEAAVAHYRATGKRNLLDIALKNADLVVQTFGKGKGKIHTVPGHQIIETGLIKLYQVTGKKEYLNLAKYFLDNRGNPKNHELYGQYSQDHIPVVDQKEVVGHAVRAVYMYAAMTDIAAIQNDSAYYKAVVNLWDNMLNKKMYITGGIGAKHDGEAFGENYELPNLTGYNETCAAIGNVYWNHRLHNLTGKAKYFDVVERTLYNGLISGLSLGGTKFFYPNPLASNGEFKFNKGSCTRKGWFDCSCCPTNLIRFIPSIPGLIYSKSKKAIYVNLYASNNAEIDFNGKKVRISQQTSYPWNGKVSIKINPSEETNFTLKLRVPGWVRNQVLPGDLYSYKDKPKVEPSIFIDGEQVDIVENNGYYSINRNWKQVENITLHFPMEVRMVQSNPKVVGNRGKVALEYGPIVYAVEEIDNKNSFDQISVHMSNDFQVQKENDLLKGVNTIKTNKLKAIPYYAWSNRGIGKMAVWLDYNKQKNKK